MDQIFNMLLLAYFDPCYMVDPPKWAMPGKNYKAIELKLKKSVRKRIVTLACNLNEYLISSYESGASTDSAISPSI